MDPQSPVILPAQAHPYTKEAPEVVIAEVIIRPEVDRVLKSARSEFRHYPGHPLGH